MHHFDAYDLVSTSYRAHLELGGGGVLFSDVIMKRLHEIEGGAEKKDASKLRAVLEEVRGSCPRYVGCDLFQYCEALVRAEGF
jgi:hypothetical protein